MSGTSRCFHLRVLVPKSSADSGAIHRGKQCKVYVTRRWGQCSQPVQYAVATKPSLYSIIACDGRRTCGFGCACSVVHCFDSGVMSMSWRIIQGDCLERMQELDNNSVDLILTDPPYFKVKNEPWDRQWDKPEVFLEWIGKLCEQWERILKPNGSLYVFASPKMAARVEVTIAERFNVLNRITWRKHDGTKNEGGLWSRANKESLRRFFEQKEEIIFAEHYGMDNVAKGEPTFAAKAEEIRGFVFEPLRAYLESERKRAGLTREDVRQVFAERLGTKGKISGHFYDRSQWMLPTEQMYQWLRECHNPQGGYEYLQREYEELRQEYEELRRPFSVTADVPYTDVWDFPTVNSYKGKHPCEKPLELLKHIVQTSSRPGAVVLDCFMGSGSTGEAALSLGREFIGIDYLEHWCKVGEARLKAVS